VRSSGRNSEYDISKFTYSSGSMFRNGSVSEDGAILVQQLVQHKLEKRGWCNSGATTKTHKTTQEQTEMKIAES